MRKFLWYIGLFFSPAAIMFVMYLILDPFRVIYHYDNYHQGVDMDPNRDYISTYNYINKRVENRYNAFILGSSRSTFWHTDTWVGYLGSNARPYHFDASGEDIYGMDKKMSLIAALGDTLHYALLIIDHQSLGDVVAMKSAPLYNRPEPINPETSIVYEQWSFYKAFLNPRFFIDYFGFKFFGKSGSVKTNRSYNPITNEVRHNFDDSLLLTTPEQFYTPERMAAFPPRDTSTVQYTEPLIKESQLTILRHIKSLLDIHRTDYRVVINPLYDMKKLNPIDVKILCTIFGTECTYDFSGCNEWTKEYRNYYEYSHYRPHVADSMLCRIYK